MACVFLVPGIRKTGELAPQASLPNTMEELTFFSHARTKHILNDPQALHLSKTHSQAIHHDRAYLQHLR